MHKPSAERQALYHALYGGTKKLAWAEAEFDRRYGRRVEGLFAQELRQGIAAGHVHGATGPDHRIAALRLTRWGYEAFAQIAASRVNDAA